MTTFTAAATWRALFAQDTPRSYGVSMSPNDPWLSLLSVQCATSDHTKTPGTAGFCIWNDVTAKVRGLEWDRGAQDPITQPEVGTATITFENTDGEMSPWATTGPFANPATSGPGSEASLVRPGMPVRFGVTRINPSTSVEAWVPFFTGFIETVAEDTQDGVDGWVTVTLVDVASQLAAIGGSQGTTGSGFFVEGATLAGMAAGLVSDAANNATDANSTTFPYVINTSLNPGDPLQNTAPLQLPDPQLNRLVALQLIATSTHTLLIARAQGDLFVTDANSINAFASTFSNHPSGAELPAVNVTPYSSTDRLLNTVAGDWFGSDGGLEPVIATSTTRPATPAVGQLVYETDTGLLKEYQGPTDGWTLPWGNSWGLIAGPNVQTTDIALAASLTQILSVTWTANPRRKYKVVVSNAVPYGTVIGCRTDYVIGDISGTAKSRFAGSTAAAASALTGSVSLESTPESGLSGSTTRYLLGRTGAGSGTAHSYGDGAFGAAIAVYDVGPNGAPA